MAFTYNLTSPGARDQLRLLIADTNSADYVYEDAELDIFLTLWGNDVQLAAVQALRTLAADQAKIAIYYRVQGFDMDRRSLPARLLELADKLEARVIQVPFEYESKLDHLIDAAGVDQSNYLDTEAT